MVGKDGRLFFIVRNEDKCHRIVHDLADDGGDAEAVDIVHFVIVRFPDVVIVVRVSAVAVLVVFHEPGHAAVEVHGADLAIAEEEVFCLGERGAVEGADAFGCFLEAGREGADGCDLCRIRLGVIGDPRVVAVQAVDVVLRGLVGMRLGRCVLRERLAARDHGGRALLRALSREAAVHMEIAASQGEREFVVREEMVERCFNDTFHVVIVCAARIDAVSVPALRKGEQISIFILELHVVQVSGIISCHVLRNRAGPCAVGSLAVVRILAHHPFIGEIGLRKVRDRAPCLRAVDGIAQRLSLCIGHECADGGKVRSEEITVAGRAHECTLRAAAAVAEGEDAVLAARDETVIVAEVADSGLQVRDAPGSAADEFRTVRVRAVFSSAASCKDIDEAFGEVRIETVRIVSGRRFLRGVSARIDRYDDRCSLSCVVSYLCLVIDNGRVRAVLIFRALHISARDVDSELLIFRRSRLCAVDEADLVVNIILLIVIPLGGVHFDRFSRERSLGRFFGVCLVCL